MDQEKYELAIVGCGPAGMSAALNAKIRKKKFILLGTEVCADKLQKAQQVDNYLGLPAVKGLDLVNSFRSHLQSQEIMVEDVRITNIYPESDFFSLMSRDSFFQAQAVILCTGVSPTKLIPGETEMIGKGAGYCATCDGPLYRGKKVALIAYTPEAEEEARYLAGVCKEVVYIPQYANTSLEGPNIMVMGGKPTRIAGEEMVTHIEIGDKRVPVDGVFILRETMPAEQLLPGLQMNMGAIVVDRTMATNIPGVFAAGDCTGKPYQLAKAVGEGAVASLSAVSYLDHVSKGLSHQALAEVAQPGAKPERAVYL